MTQYLKHSCFNVSFIYPRCVSSSSCHLAGLVMAILLWISVVVPSSWGMVFPLLNSKSTQLLLCKNLCGCVYPSNHAYLPHLYQIKVPLLFLHFFAHMIIFHFKCQIIVWSFWGPFKWQFNSTNKAFSSTEVIDNKNSYDKVLALIITASPLSQLMPSNDSPEMLEGGKCVSQKQSNRVPIPYLSPCLKVSSRPVVRTKRKRKIIPTKSRNMMKVSIVF